jgi:L-alanine-DL-glutamate epimerase-like enolase superfamily enzyme
MLRDSKAIQPDLVLLVGEDPSDPRTLWTKLVGSTFWSCKTGLGHAALAGIDMAL